MISLEAAKVRVLERIVPRPNAEVAIAEALGCVLADDAVATEPIPPFDNSSVDGYALQHGDLAELPAVLDVIGEIRAGDWPTMTVGRGQAAKIMTGAPIPAGADAIVMVEETEPLGTSVRIRSGVRLGEAIRPIGDDVQVGQLVLERGTVLRPGHLGVLAALGRMTVSVSPRLRVGVISSGDELVADGSPLRPGQIREANGELLCALLAEANCDAVNYGIVADEEDALRETLERSAAECDALITSGGVSMGDYDLVKVLLDKLGTMDWMQIAIRPAKPFAFGLIGDPSDPTPVFGLPGNPVSSLVSFELLARPALLKMMGHHVLDRPLVLAIADDGLRRNTSDDRENFVRVFARIDSDGRVHVTSTGAQGSHQLASSADANGLARVAAGAGIDPGGEVAVSLIGVLPGQRS